MVAVCSVYHGFDGVEVCVFSSQEIDDDDDNDEIETREDWEKTTKKKKGAKHKCERSVRYHTNIPLWPKIRRCQYSHTEILLHFSNKFKRVVVLKVAVLENEVSQQ